MAVKTITIDMEAYEALAARKRAGESFSKVIKRTFASERYTAENLLDHLDSITMSEDALGRFDQAVASREQDMVAEPDVRYDD